MRPALVIPAHDDHQPLDELLAQVAEIDRFAEIVVVDDASDPPLDAATLGRAAGREVTLIRQDDRRGAGAARNRGLAAVTAAHLIFFDADDVLLPDLAALLDDLDGRDFDFVLFRHLDSRMRVAGEWRQMPYDDAHWAAAGAGLGALAPLPLGAAPRLARISNYPWNKVYRTAFLRAHDIRCTEIPVHNDVELHWAGFAAATRILVSDRIACEHRVAVGSSRLTDRRGVERLVVFDALEAALARLAGNSVWRASLAAFAVDLSGWAGRLVDDAQAPEFKARRGAFFAEIADDATLARLALEDAAVARKVEALAR